MTLAGAGTPPLLFCDNETNTRRLWGVDGAAFPKDGINDHVVHGLPTVNPQAAGTKAALRYRLAVAAGDTAELRLRLARDAMPDLGDAWAATWRNVRRRPTRSTGRCSRAPRLRRRWWRARRSPG